jgi:hypothetical protein
MEMENRDNMKFEGRTVKEWRKVIGRYFEAQTTDEEESALKKFLVSPEAAGREFDEARAVLGFATVGRRLCHARRRTALRRRITGYSAAASVALVIAFSGWAVYSSRNQCVAYINGVKCTDEDVVMAEMQRSMQEMGSTASSADIGATLGDMFETMDEFKE